MQPTEFHFLLTGDHDIVLFVRQNDGSVLIRNAERSMGLKWKNGIYSADDARRLWSHIHDYGGKALSHDIGTTIAGFLQDSVQKAKDDAENEIAVKEGLIKEMRETVSRLNDTIDDLTKELDKSDRLLLRQMDEYENYGKSDSGLDPF